MCSSHVWLCSRYTWVSMMLLLILNPGRTMTPTTEVVEEDEEASSSSSMVHGTTDVMNEAWNA